MSGNTMTSHAYGVASGAPASRYLSLPVNSALTARSSVSDFSSSCIPSFNCNSQVSNTDSSRRPLTANGRATRAFSAISAATVLIRAIARANLKAAARGSGVSAAKSFGGIVQSIGRQSSAAVWQRIPLVTPSASPKSASLVLTAASITTAKRGVKYAPTIFAFARESFRLITSWVIPNPRATTTAPHVPTAERTSTQSFVVCLKGANGQINIAPSPIKMPYPISATHCCVSLMIDPIIIFRIVV